jgi:gamma-glutamyltranspeptidase/glutathione hydrolase
MQFGPRPDAQAFTAYADLLTSAYQERLAGLGDVSGAETCTTHLAAVDSEGTMVSVTNTLLSIFGSCVVLPKTGIMMNNGMFWFDPRPGHVNSIGANKRPLTNMCPVIAAKDGQPILAAGASGGRRIMPAVMQLLSFCLDFGMSVEEAAHHARLDASGTGHIDIDPRLDPSIFAALRSAGHQLEPVHNNVFPVSYASPCLIHREMQGFAGISDINSPWSAAIGAPEI